jgi:hypothetical protein
VLSSPIFFSDRIFFLSAAGAPELSPIACKLAFRAASRAVDQNRKAVSQFSACSQEKFPAELPVGAPALVSFFSILQKFAALCALHGEGQMAG